MELLLVMALNYEQLKTEKAKLTSLLAQNANLKGHDTYKAVEAKLANTRSDIKKLFRERYNAAARLK